MKVGPYELKLDVFIILVTVNSMLDSSFPVLKKKIIYLDQFAISEMMKAFNPKTPAFQKIDRFWKILFYKLDRLSRLQTICCPDSNFHEDESLLWAEYFKALREFYRNLSHGISFKGSTHIKYTQIREHCRNWIDGVPEKGLSMKPQEVIEGDINAWQEVIRFDVDLDVANIPRAKDNKELRGKVHEKFLEIFKDWQTETNQSFDERFKQYCGELGWAIWEGFRRRLEKKRAMFEAIGKGKWKVDINEISNSESEELIECIAAVLMNHGITDLRPMLNKLAEYLLGNPYLKTIPYIQIHSLLLTVLANETSHEGRRTPPDEGMYSDMQMVSLLLPYCDAIFLDKKCHGLINKIPNRYKFKWKTRVFSRSNEKEFLEYLDNLEAQIPQAHIDRVKQIYGESWLTPHTFIEK